MENRTSGVRSVSEMGVDEDTLNRYLKTIRLTHRIYTVVYIANIALAIASIVYLSHILAKQNSNFEKSLSGVINPEFTKYLREHRWIVGILIGLLAVFILNKIATFRFFSDFYKKASADTLGALNNQYKKYALINNISHICFSNVPSICYLLNKISVGAEKHPNGVLAFRLSIGFSATILKKAIIGFILVICATAVINSLTQRKYWLPFDIIGDYISKKWIIMMAVLIGLMSLIFIANCLVDIITLMGVKKSGAYHHFCLNLALVFAEKIYSFKVGKSFTTKEHQYNSSVDGREDSDNEEQSPVPDSQGVFERPNQSPIIQTSANNAASADDYYSQTRWAVGSIAPHLDDTASANADNSQIQVIYPYNKAPWMEEMIKETKFTHGINRVGSTILRIKIEYSIYTNNHMFLSIHYNDGSRISIMKEIPKQHRIGPNLDDSSSEEYDNEPVRNSFLS